MKVLLVIATLMYCIGGSSEYFFPMYDRSCMNYLNFPSLGWTQNEQNDHLKDLESSKEVVTGSVFQHLDNFFLPLKLFYNAQLQPIFSHIYKISVQYFPLLKEQCLQTLQFIPFFKSEPKVKADSRLYFLFVVTSLSIYLVLYVYFTKKLYYYYQNKLREQYLNNVKKIFKERE